MKLMQYLSPVETVAVVMAFGIIITLLGTLAVMTSGKLKERIRVATCRQINGMIIKLEYYLIMFNKENFYREHDEEDYKLDWTNLREGETWPR